MAMNPRCCCVALAGCALAVLLVTQVASAEDEVAVSNSKFDSGDHTAADWTLVGPGRWLDREILEVTGSGDDSSYWRCDGVRFEPGRLYHFQTRARRVGGSGTAITGPVFANRDQVNLTDDWQWIGHVFRVPDRTDAAYLRLGQWHATGTIQFDEVRVSPVIGVHRQFDALTLGEGEMIRDGQYTFIGTFSHQGSNHHRVLDRTTTSFNSDRWTFGSASQVVYEFALPAVNFLSAQVEVNVNYHTGGRCLVEASRDGATWHQVATADAVGLAAGPLPAGMLPAPSLQLRVRADGSSANFQVNRIEFSGRLDGSPGDAVGETVYAKLDRSVEEMAIQSMALWRDEDAGHDVLRVQVKNNSEKPVDLNLAAGPTIPLPEVQSTQGVAAQTSEWLSAVLPVRESGEHVVHFRVASTDGVLARGSLTIHVPDFYRSDYGWQLAGSGETEIWWCDATRKVPRHRAVPEAVGDAVQIAAARRDYEAAQVIVRPGGELRNLTATASALTGPGGAVIATDSISILRVYYHFVHHATDAIGVRDWWPDALPPLDEPIDVAAGQNQPLWILVHVPPDAQPGDYRGAVTLTADGFTARVPIELHVWDFRLPKRNHLETGFGLSIHNIFRYHGVKTDADKRKVLDLYFRSFAAHRISPYDPTPLDPIRVKFLPQADPPRAELDFSRFDAAMSDAIDRYDFTGFRLPVQGMGGGTFHARYPPKIGDFGEDTAQYKAMFSSYVGQLEAHLRERGWLDMAYVYWFDEPAPRDFEFVAQGMQRLKANAPGLRRMLTEEPGDNALTGLIDIWCPVSFHYDHGEAEKRRAHFERFWWYVCTGPKAPYCTLFIDHPATELRIWHWQTWQREIVGTLVWQSNYWTSSAAFPDQPQNPYLDPMGYVSGYSTPRGVKRNWGNGDGRFIYPPLAAAVPGKSGAEPVIAPPVSSIRWEMLREGVEDYEYLYMLRELIEGNREHIRLSQLRRYETLLDVPPEITSDMTTFATDSTPIYKHRRAVAEAIESLKRQLKR